MQLEYTVAAQNTNWYKHKGIYHAQRKRASFKHWHDTTDKVCGLETARSISGANRECELAWKLEIFKCVRGPHPHLEKNDNSNEAVVRDVRYCIGPSIQNLVTLRISHFIQEYFVTSNT